MALGRYVFCALCVYLCVCVCVCVSVCVCVCVCVCACVQCAHHQRPSQAAERATIAGSVVQHVNGLLSRVNEEVCRIAHEEGARLRRALEAQAVDVGTVSQLDVNAYTYFLRQFEIQTGVSFPVETYNVHTHTHKHTHTHTQRNPRRQIGDSPPRLIYPL